MKKLLLLFCIILSCSSCSMIPRFTFNRPGVTPQKEEYTKTCHTKRNGLNFFGIIQLGKLVTVCTQEKNKEERVFTWQERVANIVRNASGILFWGGLALLIFCPSVIGLILGRVFNGSRRALESTVAAISRAKKNGGNFMVELEKEHSKDPSVKKLINEIRAKVK